MKAFVIRGKRMGELVTISQWCNDWFMISDGSILAPSSLAFKKEDMDKVLNHNNNGTLEDWFEPCVDKYPKNKDYNHRFRRRKFNNYE